jgi:ATP-dependent DNA ligase
MHPQLAPIIPVRRPETLDDPAWATELKLDGFRGLADTINGRMLSKNLNPLKRFHHLLDALPLDCVFDGEICVLDSDGQPTFNDLLCRIRNVTSSPMITTPSPSNERDRRNGYSK